MSEHGGEGGHSVWPMSERQSNPYTSPQADAVSEALQGFHQPHDENGLLPRHNGTWHDSLALTHCLCWGAAWRMLDYLVANPDVYERVSRSGGQP